ncbi:reverse transcriptase domain-containing protein [Tanacetum coccineum]
MLFLVVSHETISSVFMAEKKNIQRPIYFVSKALQGPEAYTICVLTYKPICQILLKPESSDRLAKWAIKLGEHNVIYKPRIFKIFHLLKNASFAFQVPHLSYVLSYQLKYNSQHLHKGLKTRLGKAKGQWVEKLPNVLWAHRTTAKIGNHCTPFSRVYRSEAVLPPNIGIPTYRIQSYEENKNNADLRLNLELLEDQRELASLCEAKYKCQTERYYNSKVRHAHVGDFVLYKNKASRQEGHKNPDPNREGPYHIIEAKRPGTYVLIDLHGKLIPRTWHISNLPTSEIDISCSTYFESVMYINNDRIFPMF